MMRWNKPMPRYRRAAVPAADSAGVPPQAPTDRGSAPRRSPLRGLLLTTLASLAFALPSFESRAEEEDRFELRAILTVAGARHAMFADTEASGKTHMLRSGEDKDDLQLVALDPAKGSVVIRHRGRRHPMQMDAPPDAASASPRGVIWLQNATIADITAIYQRITTRTVLRASDLGDVSFSFREQNFDTPKAASRLIEAFKEKEIDLIPNGKRFAIARRHGSVIPALPNYAEIVEAASDTSKRTSESRLMQVGSVNFPNLDLSQFLEFYAELTERTVLKPAALQGTALSLVTQTDMNRWEAIYALDMTLALNGLKSTFLGDKFTAITELNYDTGQLPGPPDPDPDAAMIKPGAIRFNKAPAKRAFQRYQELAKARVVASQPNLAEVSVDLENRDELAANEAAWAVETVLRLNGIHFQHTDDNNVRAQPVAKAPDAKN